MRHPLFAVAAAASLLSGCAGSIIGDPQVTPKPSVVGGPNDVVRARTPGERSSGFGYIPLDPIGVRVNACPARVTSRPLFEALPDLAVRFAVADIDANAGATFGPSKVTVEGGTYRAILDYVNADTIPVEFRIRAILSNASGERAYHYPSQPVPQGYQLVAYEAVIIDPAAPSGGDADGGGWNDVTIPVYVGIGLRLFADIYAINGGVTLSGLGVIGANAEANALSGTLTVQTLGITGKSIAVSLPLPSKLDQTTIENAILAVGGTRALMYGNTTDDVVTATPRIVGLYSPIGSDPRLINAVYSELARRSPKWDTRYCRPATA